MVNASSDMKNKPGISFQAAVTLTGPDKNPDVSAITIGFIQHYYLAASSAVYAGNTSLVDNFVKIYYLDRLKEPKPGMTGLDPKDPNDTPWYWDNTVAQNIGYNQNVPAKITGQKLVDDEIIGAADNNQWAWPEWYINKNVLTSKPLTQVVCSFDFTLDVAAQTNSPTGFPNYVLAASQYYWGQAWNNWTFNVDKTIEGPPFNWTKVGEVGTFVPGSGGTLNQWFGTNYQTPDLISTGEPIMNIPNQKWSFP